MEQILVTTNENGGYDVLAEEEGGEYECVAHVDEIPSGHAVMPPALEIANAIASRIAEYNPGFRLSCDKQGIWPESA